MKNSIESKLQDFLNRYPGTILWRKKKHARVAQKYITADEEVLYVFGGQRTLSHFDIFQSTIVILTSKRILVAHSNVLFSHRFLAITPDMFNDLTVKGGPIWGRIIIDTIKEKIYFSKIDKKALVEIKNEVSTYMIQAKKDYTKPFKKALD